MESRQLVLGTAVGYDFQHMAAFVLSLRRTGFRGEIALLVGDLDPLTRLLLRHHGVTPVPIADESLLAESIAATTGRVAAAFDPRSVLALNLDIQSLRYVLYAGYLARRAQAFDVVLLTDVRDVFFQASPFVQPVGEDTLLCAVEDARIGESEVNSAWVLEAFDRSALDQLAGFEILCSGTTLGSLRRIREYVAHMARETLERPSPMRGLDQGIHNYILRKGLVGGLRCCTNRDGPFLTLEGAQGWTLTAAGEVRGPSGAITPIVHQYDRSPELKALAERLFSPGRIVSRGLKFYRRRRRRAKG